jgi:hypothetical protein
VRTVFVLLLLTAVAEAHQPSSSRLTLDLAGDRLSGRWDVAARDLHHALGLDADGDGALTWREIAAREREIAAYLGERLAVAGCRLDPGALRAAPGGDVVLPLTGACAAAPTALAIDYRLFFDLDAQHRGLVQAGGRAVVFAAPGAQTIALAGDDPTFAAFTREGVRHIWLGFDHLLFLLALLLPAVLHLERRRWQAASDLRTSAVETLAIVTSFTLAHSITLALATMDLVRLPSRLVETAIAVSVALAAAANVLRLRRGRAGAAFALGLLHGFGFSGALVELGLPSGSFARALLGFNLGVELGQLAVVALFLPLAWALRRTAAYRAALVAASLAIFALAAVWSVERLVS